MIARRASGRSDQTAAVVVTFGRAHFKFFAQSHQLLIDIALVSAGMASENGRTPAG
jgi:hypothetical protein